MATAKKAAPAKTSKKTKAAPAEAAEDDLLATKKPAAKKAKKAAPAEDDLLSTKKAAPAKKAKKAAPAEDEPTAEDVRNVLLKTRKATSYTDIAEANGFNIRMVRRQARALRDTGEVEISKEGTLGFVKVAKK